MPVLHLKQRICVSEPHFGVGLTGNICDSSLAGWKACSQLPINYNSIFSLYLTVEALIRLNRPLWKGVCQFGAKY